MQLSGHTRPFAVLGHPIGHSLSPVMHNAAFQSLGMDAVYLAFDVRPERLMSVLPSLADLGFGGVNLTVPLKEIAFSGLSDLDESARRLGAVNTVQFLPDGALRGHNTDGDGFLAAVEEAFGSGVTGRSVFLLGTGGAGRAVALTCAARGAARIAVSDIEAQRAEQVADEIGDTAPAVEVSMAPSEPAALERACREADLVVHCTPVGMKKGEPSLLGAGAFRNAQMVFDLIYMYPETVIMRAARQGGARTANGLGMLLHQGARAFTIWTGRSAAVEAMRSALQKQVYG
jgi:shikimate dehydrogenase